MEYSFITSKTESLNEAHYKTYKYLAFPPLNISPQFDL